MSNIFEMYPDRFADEKAYVQKLIKLFDDSRFAYECGANLINILLSTLPEAPGSKRKLINVKNNHSVWSSREHQKRRGD